MKGGLGNQLFQLACGLGRVRGELKHLYFNTSYYLTCPRQGRFVLDRLFPDLSFQTTHARTFNVPTATLNFDHVPSLYVGDSLNLECPLHLIGYFQNYRHLKPILPELREMFRRNTREILQCDVLPRWPWGDDASTDERPPFVIGVHLRRGDYLDPETASVHGTVAIEDVMSAIDSERAVIGTGRNVRVIAFSDSKELVSDLGMTLYTPNLLRDKIGSDIEEFVAMANCDSLICSNSTYSYWAGVISGRVRRLYLPDSWMKSGRIQSEDLLPEGNGRLFVARLS